MARPSPTRWRRSSSATRTGRRSRRRRPRASAVCLRRCLEKDVGRRLRDIGDAVSRARRGHRPLRAAGRCRRRRLRRRFGLAAGRRWRDRRGISTVVLAGLLWRDLGACARASPSPCSRRSRRSRLNRDSNGFRVCRRTASGSCTAATPTAIATSILQSTTGQTPINLTADSTDDDDQPAFSPDGERIAFRSSRDGGGIFVMGRTGEAVRRVTRRGLQADVVARRTETSRSRPRTPTSIRRTRWGSARSGSSTWRRASSGN